MSAARDFRPLGLGLAVSSSILALAGCSAPPSGVPSKAAGGGAIQDAKADEATRFEVIEQAPEDSVEVADRNGDLFSQEQILANLEDGRQFMESLQAASEEDSASQDSPEAPMLVEEAVLNPPDPLHSAAAASETSTISEVLEAASQQRASLQSRDDEDADPASALIRSLMRSASQSDAPLKQHLALAVIFAWVAPDKPFEPQGLSELTDQERQLVEIVYQQFKQLGSELEEGGDGSVLARAFADIITMIDAESPFQITRIKLCSAVRDYGDIDEFDPPMFSPSERSKFIWYVELDGADPFLDETTGNYGHDFVVRTEMFSRDTGVPVVPPVENTVRHDSTSRIRDLFLRNVFEIPESLQYGWYTVKITVRERESDTQSQMGLDLLWVPSLAAGTEHFERRRTTAVAE